MPTSPAIRRDHVADSPPPARILLTGGGGFVGRHLVAALRARWPDAQVLQPDFDVRDAAAVQAAVTQAAPACCVHLAAIASIPAASQNEDAAWQVNLHGTLHVARAIMAHAPGCQMLFISSADAYGASFRGGVALDETAPLAPMNIYGATKAAADLALGAMAMQGLRVVRLRPFNHIGAGQSPDFAIASFARQIARIEAGLQPPVLQTGRLDTYRDFLDVEDVCAAYVACIARRDMIEPGAILNIASGEPRRIGDLLDALAVLSDVAMTLSTQTPLLRPTDIPRACGNANRAREVLGWSPGVPLSATLAAVLADWRARVGTE
jgi:GDP-4-dehydro-6-deoxy-D-mannose reductase